MKKRDKKIEKDKNLFERFKKIVDSINESPDLSEDIFEEDNILGNLALKAEDLLYNLELAWEIKPDNLSEKEKQILMNLLKSSKQLRNKIFKIIEDIKPEDANIGRA